jgi:hypothetical protein
MKTIELFELFPQMENRAVNPVHPIGLPLLDACSTQDWNRIKVEIEFFVMVIERNLHRYSLTENKG